MRVMPGTQDMKRTKQIHDLYASGMSYSAIGRRFGISPQRVQQLVRPPVQVVNMLRARAKNRCEWCEIPLRSGHVHHVVKVGHFTKDRSSLDKLLYLCATCHREAHTGPRPANTTKVECPECGRTSGSRYRVTLKTFICRLCGAQWPLK